MFPPTSFFIVWNIYRHFHTKLDRKKKVMCPAIFRSISIQKYSDEREQTDHRWDWPGGFDQDGHNSTEPQRHDASMTTEPDRKGWDPGSGDYPPLVDLAGEKLK